MSLGGVFRTLFRRDWGCLETRRVALGAKRGEVMRGEVEG